MVDRSLVWRYRSLLNDSKTMALISLFALLPVCIFVFNRFFPYLNEREYIYVILFRFPIVAFFAIAFLGIKLNQTRILFTALLLGASYLFVTSMPHYQWFAVDRSSMARILTIAVPLSLAILYTFREGRTFGLLSLGRLMICSLPLLFMMAAISADVIWFREILLVRGLTLGGAWRIPLISFFGLILLAASVLFLKDRSVDFFKMCVLPCMIPFFFVMNHMADRKLSQGDMYISIALNFSAICFLLMFAIYRLYWQKAYIDELTGIANRRALDEKLRNLGRRYSIAMIDIDHFKNFNDTFGHSEGDHVLRFVGKHLYVGAGSHAYRYGGEEFCILFPGHRTLQHVAKLDSIRQKLADTVFYIRAPGSIRDKTTKKDRQRIPPQDSVISKITFSAGLACRTKELKKPEEVIEAADQALYQAKKAGRNRVVGPEGTANIIWK